MSKRLLPAVVVAAAIATLTACSERPQIVAPTLPTDSPAAALPAAALLPSVPTVLTTTANYTVHTVNRVVPLYRDVSWSFVASPRGTTVMNPSMGLTMHVPAGAVSEPTTITVTAKAGVTIDYQFAPHGLQFAQPVTLTQNMMSVAGPDALQGPIEVAYYSSAQLQYDSRSRTAVVNEFEPTNVAFLPPRVSWDIRHFSGYVVAFGAW